MSRVNFGAKPIMFPQPVLIIATYDENGVPNAMNAAWGITTDFSEITISLGEHKTTDNLEVRKAFTVSMATEDQVVACDYVGIESGRKVPDKFEKAGFHATKSEFVDAPLIDELPLALECRVKSFEDGILIGEIVNVSADDGGNLVTLQVVGNDVEEVSVINWLIEISDHVQPEFHRPLHRGSSCHILISCHDSRAGR